jgi:hypothetical protein
MNPSDLDTNKSHYLSKNLQFFAYKKEIHFYLRSLLCPPGEPDGWRREQLQKLFSPHGQLRKAGLKLLWAPVQSFAATRLCAGRSGANSEHYYISTGRIVL